MRRIKGLSIHLQGKSDLLLNKRKLSVHVEEEIKHALEKKQPVVALESTIITHGMPYPENVKCAMQVEDVVRQQGAVPATIGIVHGRIKVGLTKDEINILGDTKTSVPIKASRRDIAYVVSTKSNGGTTVSSTLLVANKVKIPIFATGGIGGVHRGSETTFDISADLTELGKTDVAVVSSGVKSILDIPKTLEYLETQGVFVATFGESNEFPAFYSRKSGCQVPYFTENVVCAAQIIKTHRELELHSGMLFAVPIPEEYALDSNVIDEAIEKALREAKRDGIQGKKITPYLLSRIALITEGQSLRSNIALIQNNAKVAANIAVALSSLENGGNGTKRVPEKLNFDVPKRPIVIGGSNLDYSAMLKTTEIELDGRIYDGKFTYTAGGVGRNICEAMAKMGFPPNFLTMLGNDQQGNSLEAFIPEECRQYVKRGKTQSTAQCTIIFDARGSCKMLMGDMEIHKEISPQMIQENENILKNSTMIIIDANLSLDTMEECLKIAEKCRIPVFFEPTDVEVAIKPFKTTYSQAVKYVSPNLNELRRIGSFFGIPSSNYPSKLQEAAHISTKLLDFVENIFVTLGSEGLLIARKGLATDNFQENLQFIPEHVRHYPTEEIHDLVNVSGAGDCFSSGFIAALISGMSEEVCVSVGFAAARLALQCQAAVPTKMFDKGHECWKTSAKYETIL